MIFVGIDPGKHGAIAWMDGERKHIQVHDCPLLGDDYDYRGMHQIFVQSFDVVLKSCDLATDGTVAVHRAPIVTLEDVHALPTDGRCSAFSFGVGFGAWLALLGFCDIKPNLVSPQAWKRTMLAGIANDKHAEGLACKQRFQGHSVVSQLQGPRGGIRDGRVDALLLAEYGRLQWKLSPEVKRCT